MWSGVLFTENNNPVGEGGVTIKPLDSPRVRQRERKQECGRLNLLPRSNPHPNLHKAKQLLSCQQPTPSDDEDFRDDSQVHLFKPAL